MKNFMSTWPRAIMNNAKIHNGNVVSEVKGKPYKLELNGNYDMVILDKDRIVAEVEISDVIYGELKDLLQEAAK